ncbi:MAG: hypothetical protein UY61_C0049G0018 [Candidatus Adlerbacteria bacterium GW2011_GWC1_50_9]|uniref:Uncharacterized protein n=1 Tax=Candidatus Adlerbacteria bacterium GW2011_GWC1_50_9 TaxID=1618608 RepID=A0A0G1WM10_9BACT|nr:MAG: hypothetical protein UY61_C0049G0018 [Candidatus Adlerbacteria bacterium GW2011_GWC1_50_9]
MPRTPKGIVKRTIAPQRGKAKRLCDSARFARKSTEAQAYKSKSAVYVPNGNVDIASRKNPPRNEKKNMAAGESARNHKEIIKTVNGGTEKNSGNRKEIHLSPANARSSENTRKTHFEIVMGE